LFAGSNKEKTVLWLQGSSNENTWIFWSCSGTYRSCTAAMHFRRFWQSFLIVQ